ncbi:hypothetical protein Pmani_027373 [Petrolisthes manimaculis]|uniref:Uncharacterized protein n=1 Tax=Petrolisthes manimaculis TaxID=1843537 RepID=A0AAE1P3X0_9EUCA|nr:hypothetical protein Pmani_028636 [Petrolisthes manimaculis]KAK4300432.1 hypothetical protein Pmani_027373 [Petrolisthes manimaculis]
MFTLPPLAQPLSFLHTFHLTTLLTLSTSQHFSRLPPHNISYIRFPPHNPSHAFHLTTLLTPSTSQHFLRTLSTSQLFSRFPPQPFSRLPPRHTAGLGVTWPGQDKSFSYHLMIKIRECIVGYIRKQTCRRG